MGREEYLAQIILNALHTVESLKSQFCLWYKQTEKEYAILHLIFFWNLMNKNELEKGMLKEHDSYRSHLDSF